MKRILISLTLASSLLLTACGGGSDDAAEPAASSGSGLSGEITVFAAASLTGSFTELGKSFEGANPGTTVKFSFGPSSGLATQIINGAPADVFASASPKNMTQVTDADAADEPSTFAKNSMEIAVPPGNPAGVKSVADLAKGDVKVVLCAAEVPCGATALTVFKNAGITVKPVSNEVDVKSTLNKVTLGEADAGVVYITDVKAAGDKVEGVEIPADVNASTEYPIATLTESKNADLAKAFVDFVKSGVGTTALGEAGFQQP